MRIAACLGAALVAACAGSTKPPTGAGSGSAAVSAPVITAGAGTTCEDVRPKVVAMYREDAQRNEPKRVDDAVADNTAMVMVECKRDPAKAVPCLAAAGSLQEIEHRCLAPLDPEGTEGDQIGRAP